MKELISRLVERTFAAPCRLLCPYRLPYRVFTMISLMGYSPQTLNQKKGRQGIRILCKTNLGK